MDTKSLAQPAHPTTEERPCACYGGFVFVGHLVEGPEADEEVEASEPVPCKRCADL